jgi:hypothetical protein
MRAWFEMLKEFGEALAALGFSVSARKTVLHSLCNAYHLAVSWSTPSNWSIPQWSQVSNSRQTFADELGEGGVIPGGLGAVIDEAARFEFAEGHALV